MSFLAIACGAIFLFGLFEFVAMCWLVLAALARAVGIAVFVLRADAVHTRWGWVSPVGVFPGLMLIWWFRELFGTRSHPFFFHAASGRMCIWRGVFNHDL